MVAPLLRTAAALSALSLAALSPAALAVPLPTSPTDPTIAHQWVNPELRAVDSSSEISSRIESISADAFELTLVNDSGAVLSDVSVRVQRANPVTSVAQARTVLADEESTYHVSTPFQAVPIELAPGESHTFSVKVDHGALDMAKDGVYPVLINVNGELGQGGQQFLASERTLIQVGTPRPEHPLAPVTMLIPVTAQSDILPGETGEAPNQPPLILQSEQLAKDIAPTGRLTKLLDAHRRHAATSCLAVDPEVALTVSRMADGYQIAEERPNPVAHKPRLRDSWGSKNNKIDATPGQGSTDARAWLKQLTDIAQGGGCVVPMSWANAELNAVAATGNAGLLHSAALEGSAVLSELLGAPVRHDVIIPGFGYLEQRTATSLDELLPAPATALVADNTLPDSAVSVGQHLTALGYDAALASQLGTLGDTPGTVGYSNQWQRFDYRLDSNAARRSSATAALYLAATDDDQPLLVVPPADLQVEDATALLDQMQHLIDAGVATGQPLNSYLAAPPKATASLTGSPFEDPTVVTDTEILRASQQAKSIDDLTSLMTVEPTIALTPQGFTEPLRRDLLRAMSASGRRTLMGYDSRVQTSDAILRANSDILQQLRSSVVLLPPGNVYTRTSESSPLFIVAENGLPLPVDARISYTGPEDAIISVADSLKIPARGSITTQMMADLPETKSRTDLTVWLASQNGAPISYPVDIGVQTRSGVLGTGGIVALLLAALAFVMFHVKRR
ncbi:hypothetical protein CKALI_12225 [Corynebacterium kalinowskii]|uniref:Secreted protein n=1 Tax=Corynebacterium kalinowskii TaxID=2675216 RepID=A0A6B8VGK1_9CORY|nr:hypothetical protein [Corynebacterium kalinowskii]QGU03283.1 hypothetical protein CKALI_12225 [Corynebacterium kalinowskii]